LDGLARKKTEPMRAVLEADEIVQTGVNSLDFFLNRR
jgi:hypothetical protein